MNNCPPHNPGVDAGARLGSVIKRSAALVLFLAVAGCRTGVRNDSPGAVTFDPESIPPAPIVVVYADGRIEVEPPPAQPGARRPKYHYEDPTKTAPAAVRDYDEALVAAIETKWVELSKLATKPHPANVVIDFNLHPDGTISGLAVSQGDPDSMLVDVAKQAILESVPFPAWPEELRRLIETERRPVRFTFRYAGRLANGQAGSSGRGY